MCGVAFCSCIQVHHASLEQVETWIYQGEKGKTRIEGLVYTKE